MRFEVMTRRQAKARGLKKYWSGERCINNHESLRYTSSGICVSCRYLLNKKYYNKQRRADELDLIKVELWIYPEDAEALTNAAEDLIRQRIESQRNTKSAGYIDDTERRD